MEKNNAPAVNRQRLRKQLELPELTYGTEHLMNHFDELSTTRHYNPMSGLPEPLTYTEIKAYTELTFTELSHWEVNTLKLMDTVFINEAAAFRSD